MYYPNDAETGEMAETVAEHQMIIDGTVSLDEIDDDSIPRVRGLVELFHDFLGD